MTESSSGGRVGAGLHAPSPIGTIRVDIDYQGQKAFGATLKGEDRSFELQIDEPIVRGGQSTGVWPLGYFVTGAASCLAMQYVNVIRDENIAGVEGIKMLARAHNDREAKIFTDMIFQVSLTGSITPERAEALARAASARCYVENTLVKAIPLTTELELNGRRVATLSRTPAES
jgi:uncharacterized OsmC-like protein